MIMVPKLRQLQYLIALADNKSFSKAADTCLVTQSTLSAGIRDMEDLLGHDVVDRSTRRVVLTPFGQEILTRARAILKQTEDLATYARSLEDPFSGSLRLGIIPTIAPYVLPSLIPQVNEAHPNLDLQIHEDLTARLVDRLNRGELDMILIAFPYAIKGLSHKILTKEPFVIAAAKGTLKTTKPFAIKDLEHHTVLLLEDGHCLRDHALEACALSPKESWKTFSATSLQTLIEMVKNGYGITLLPEMAVSPSLTKTLDIIPFKTPKPSRDIGLAWRPGSTVEAISAALAQTFAAAITP